MSVPVQTHAVPSGVTSAVTGQVSYGWISEAWRWFSVRMGVWIAATVVMAAPVFAFAIVFYALMWTTMFPGGFPSTAQTLPPPSSHGFPAPLTPGAVLNSGMGSIWALEAGFGLVYAFWSAFMYGGLFRMAVRQVRGLPLELKDIFRGGPLFGRMLGAMLLLGLSGYFLEAVCVGPMGLLTWRHGPIAAIIAAGIIGVVLLLALELALAGLLLPSFALMADGDGALTALKRSIRAMKAQWAAAAGFVFVLGALWYAGALLCYVGLLATTPMIFLVCALAYRDMVGMPNMVPPPAPYYPPAQAGTWPPPPSISFPEQLFSSDPPKGTSE